MDLELLSRRPQGRTRPTPLLFVHGAFGGAWVWDHGFLDAFAAAGWSAHALSLRGHGGSDGSDRLALTRFADYVDDVIEVARTLPSPPVLIGHSMGGLVVQACLHRLAVPAAVLMASAPPHGLLGGWFNMALLQPQLMMQLWLMQVFGPSATNLDVLKQALFSDSVDDATVLRLLPRFGMESPLAILDMLGLDPLGGDLPPSRPALDLPVLVLGASDDAFVYPGALAETARTYRTAAEVFPGMAHAMMLDDGWPVVAGRILAFLELALGDRPVAALPPPAATAAAARVGADR